MRVNVEPIGAKWTYFLSISTLRLLKTFSSASAFLIQTRNKTKCALEQLGFTVLDSKTNFLFARCPKISGEDYYSKLKQNGILVRHFDQERIQDFVRITIGTPAQMEQFLQVTKRLMEEETQ